MTDRSRSDQSASPFAWTPSLDNGPFWTAVAQWARTVEPVARSATRCQLEMSSLVGQRAKAWAEIPSTLAACRSPTDLMQAQMAFWQVATRNYMDTSRHVMDAWRGALPSFSDAMAESAAERDYITFPEPKEDAAPEARRHPGASRKAA